VLAFGAIALARFPFTDLSGDKRGPVLIVSRDNGRRHVRVAPFVVRV
jgi:mRNA interferase MazF